MTFAGQELKENCLQRQLSLPILSPLVYSVPFVRHSQDGKPQRSEAEIRKYLWVNTLDCS